MKKTWKIAKTKGSYDRTLPPEVTVETLMRLRVHYGITRVTEITGLDVLGLPVHCAIRPRSVSMATISCGKGVTTADSLAGALAEAIECDCCERFDPPDKVQGSAQELRLTYPLILPQQGLPQGKAVPENLRLEWAWVQNLMAEEGTDGRVLFPLDFIRQGSVGHRPGALFAQRLSDGLASGNVYEEAVCHAIDELIERDAVAIFMFRGKFCQEDLRGTYQRIRLGTLPDVPARLVQSIQQAGRRVSLLDITSDVRVPTVLCNITPKGEMGGAQCVGAGTSFTAERAVIRAITEAAQTSTVNVQGTREDLVGRDPRIHPRSIGIEWRGTHTLFWDPYLPEKPFDALPSIFHPYIDQDLDELITRLRAAGVRQAIACDVADTNCVGFSVVRVVIPELELMRMDTIGRRRLRYGLA